MSYELDCVVKQRFVSQSISHRRSLGVTRWSLPVLLQFCSAPYSAPHLFWRSCIKTAYKADLQHCKMHFSGFTTGKQPFPLPLWVGHSQADQVWSFLFCAFGQVHCTWMCVCVHCTWVCVSGCIAQHSVE